MYIEHLINENVEESSSAFGGASFAEKVRIFIVVTFSVCFLEFAVMACVWRACWRNKQNYWTYRILFMIYYVPNLILALVLAAKWASAEDDVHKAYEALSNSPINECGDMYTKFPY